MENEEELKQLRLGFTMERALEKYLNEIQRITLEMINKLEVLFYEEKNKKSTNQDAE